MLLVDNWQIRVNYQSKKGLGCIFTSLVKITEQIKQPIAYEMELFEQKFRLAMSSKVALLNRITHYIVNRKGKQMRPMFVFLVAKIMNNGEVSERTYRGASVIELIHKHWPHLFTFTVNNVVCNTV